MSGSVSVIHTGFANLKKFFVEFVFNSMMNKVMGHSNTKYLSELSSDDSDSDTDSAIDEEEESLASTKTTDKPKIETQNVAVSANPSTFLTTDAAIKSFSSFPKAENVLNLDLLLQIEKEELGTDEIISLGFLLYEETHCALQELVLRSQDTNKIVLYGWAQMAETKGISWQKKVIEALCVIKNYRILRKLGYNKTEVMSHYMPLSTNLSLHISKMRKILYILCEELDKKKTEQFLQYVRQCFKEKKLDFIQYDPDYLEMFLLHWETISFITKIDISNVKKVFKTMGEEIIYNMLDVKILDQKEEKQPILKIQQKDLVNDKTLLGVIENHKPSSSLRKTFTSVDNHNQRNESPTENTPYGSSNMLPSLQENTVTQKLQKYNIDPLNPGIVLIINQEDFYTEFRSEYRNLLPPDTSMKLESRKGTEKDRDDLKHIFTKFGFKVIVEDNLTHKAMLDKISEVVKSVTAESSIFVCILSHGDRGMVYGANSCRVKVSKIESVMCKANRENLAEKPKVLILQSCQGQECQKVNNDSSTEEEDEYNESLALATDSGNRRPLPRTVDMLTFWATVPGYAAIRHKKTGSWFIQALCKKMEDLGSEYHFADICTSVVNEVTGKIWNKQEDRNAMTPMVVHTLRYPFYLPPLKK